MTSSICVLVASLLLGLIFKFIRDIHPRTEFGYKMGALGMTVTTTVAVISIAAIIQQF